MTTSTSDDRVHDWVGDALLIAVRVAAYSIGIVAVASAATYLAVALWLVLTRAGA